MRDACHGQRRAVAAVAPESCRIHRRRIDAAPITADLGGPGLIYSQEHESFFRCHGRRDAESSPLNRHHFADVPEFNWISALLGPEALRFDGMGPGDDACLTPMGDHRHQAISVDASVEGIHYRLDWVAPAEALLKCVLSNLSDINAMGGRTRQLFLALGMAPGWGASEAESLGQVLREMAARYGFQVAGGDTVRVKGASFFSVTVVGMVEGRPLLRSAAEPGDGVFVSGDLGLSSYGLELLLQDSRQVSLPIWRREMQGVLAHGQNETKPALSLSAQAVMAHLLPSPPLDLGPALANLGRRVAAIDLSDGLSSELGHLSRQSACRIEVDWSKLPYEASLGSQLSPEGLRRHVLHGGEEYQLVFTGQFTEKELALLRSLATVTEIGRVLSGEGVWLRDGGLCERLPAGGFGH
jgi:thiamine-monophosphate kinase